jgi:NAD(P)-dependent dehydrogenase (short-subunit alcohol dehydrogenase family)
MQANIAPAFTGNASSIHQCHDQRDYMNQSAPTARLRLENQVAVVTGGTRGIGEGIVRRFVEEGAKAVLSGRSSDKGKALEEELSPNVAFYRADAASASDTEALMRFTAERFGRLDCVVNNAGVGGEGGPIAGTSVEGFNKSLALLVGGAFLGIKYGVPFMKAGGTIINIASVASLVGGYGSHAYTTAKFGVVGLTKSVALELAERGIRVNAICVGGVATAIFAPIGGEITDELNERTPEIVEPWLAEILPLGRSGFPVDIANAALWLASSESSFVTGEALTVDGGLTAGRRWSHTLQRYDQLRERFRSALDQTSVI